MTAAPAGRVTFPRILASEWIKLRTLRSSVWCGAIAVVLTVAAGLLLAAAVRAGAGGVAAQQSVQVTAITLGARFTQLIACIFGVLVIGGEYASGMIRTTFIAVPRRWPAVLGKLLVLAAVVFVTSLVATVLTAAVATPILVGKGIEPRLLAPEVLLPLLGASLYLALLAVLAFLISVVVRNSAAGIAIILGLVLVVPIVLNIVAAVAQADWARNLAAVLPSSAGERLYGYTADDPGGVVNGQLTLTPGWAVVALLAWIAVAGVIAFLLVDRRDV